MRGCRSGDLDPHYMDVHPHGWRGLYAGCLPAEERRRGVHWDFREGRETWYALTFREEADGVHYYLERPILRVELFDFDSNYNRGGDAMFESWSDDAMETEAIYFGLGEDAVLLWKEGEEVDLPAATAAQEEMWAIAELPPQEVPQE